MEIIANMLRRLRVYICPVWVYWLMAKLLNRNALESIACVLYDGTSADKLLASVQIRGPQPNLDNIEDKIANVMTSPQV